MIFTKKSFLALSFISFIGFSSIFANNDEETKTGISEKAISTIQNQAIINVLTRIAAKSAFEIGSKKTFGKPDCNTLLSLKQDAFKALTNGAIEEINPLKKEANIALQHTDLLAPTVIKSLYDDQKSYNVNYEKDNLKKMIIASLKKETDKGFLINKDFRKLRTPQEIALFVADCLTETIGDDFSFNHDENVKKKILNNKILTPLVMTWFGDDVVKGMLKTKNKNVIKAFAGLVRNYLVSNLFEQVLVIKK